MIFGLRAEEQVGSNEVKAGKRWVKIEGRWNSR